MNDIKTGRISEIQKNTFFIMYQQEELPAKLKGKFYNDGEEWPVVGDYVDFEYNPIGDSMIAAIQPRKSILKRPDFYHMSTSVEQVMCANFDYCFIVTSLNDNYNFNRVARYVSITLQGGGIPVVILTKCDLCSNPGRYIREIEDLSDKVRVHSISALYGIGIDELREYLQPDKTIALIGSSGVGKSTLVNALFGEKKMKTSEVREEDSRGRHTTTYRKMMQLPCGTTVIDTPGMREIGLYDVNDGIDETFEDVTDLATRCRFSNCKHDTEPGCAVKKAIADGILAAERLELYRNMYNESSKAAKLKSIAKARRQLNDMRN